MVFLPIARYRGLASLVARSLGTAHLEHLQPVQGETIRLDHRLSRGHTRSTARVGTFISATLDAASDDTLTTLAMVGKNNLTINTAVKYTSELPNGTRDAAVILTYFNGTAQPQKNPTIIAPLDAVKHYTFHPLTEEIVNKPSMVAFMSPLLDECYAPVRSLANDKASIQQRLTKFMVLQEKVMDKPKEFTRACMIEFARLLIPIKHLLDPSHESRVYETQNRPGQQRLLHDADAGGARNTAADAMQKAEAYGNIKDPRNITIIRNTDHKRDWSRYMYAFTDMLKVHPWYAFGLTPCEIAERVAEICQGAKSLNNSDLSRFDGHVGFLFRELEMICTMRAFHPRHHAEMLELQRSQYNLEGTTRHGYKYSTGWSRLSGSPETSPFNTICNTFISYLALRRTVKPGGHGFLQATEAWAKLGLYGGDDGITPDLSAAKLRSAATETGQVSTCVVIKRGEAGVEFLARRFSPDVWNGDTTSMCDIKRQLSKFHATAKVDVIPTDKARQKALSYYLTDGNTPIIGPLVTRMLEILGPPTESTNNRIVSWFGRFPKDVQFPNGRPGGKPPDWMMDIVNQDLPNFDHAMFENWLENTAPENILRPPLCAPSKPAKPATTNAVVLPDDFVAGTAHATEVINVPSLDGRTKKNPPVKPVKTPSPTLPIATIRTHPLHTPAAPWRQFCHPPNWAHHPPQPYGHPCPWATRLRPRPRRPGPPPGYPIMSQHAPYAFGNAGPTPDQVSHAVNTNIDRRTHGPRRK